MTSGGLTHWAGEPIQVLAREWGLAHLEAYDDIGSTNDRARDLAAAGAVAPAMVISARQAAGRGRNGRSWAAPIGGLWTSFLLDYPIAHAPWMPLAVGAAVAQAIEEVCLGVHVLMKWPNDLLIEGAKVCGILCEGVGDDRVVVGIGVNVAVRRDDFPAEVRGKAVSLMDVSTARVSMARLACGIVQGVTHLDVTSEGLIAADVLDEIRARDVFIGCRVRASSSGVVGIGCGIDSGGALVLQEANGARTPVNSGSVEALD